MTRDDTEPGSGSGEGGAMGTPSVDHDEASPGIDQEKNTVVSGGGVANESDPDEDPSDAAERSPSSQAPRSTD